MYHAPGSPTSWRNFAGNMVPSLESVSGDYMSSASALMQLGSGQRETVGTPEMNHGDINGDTGQMWPTMVFDRGAGVG